MMYVPPIKEVSGPSLTVPKGTVAAGLSIPQVHGVPPVPINGSTYCEYSPVTGSGISMGFIRIPLNRPASAVSKITIAETKILIIGHNIVLALPIKD